MYNIKLTSYYITIISSLFVFITAELPEVKISLDRRALESKRLRTTDEEKTSIWWQINELKKL